MSAPSPKAIVALLNKHSPSILMLSKPEAHIEYELVEKSEVGNELFQQLKHLERETLSFQRAFRISGDTVLIATEHLKQLAL